MVGNSVYLKLVSSLISSPPCTEDFIASPFFFSAGCGASKGRAASQQGTGSQPAKGLKTVASLASVPFFLCMELDTQDFTQSYVLFRAERQSG